MADQTPSDNAPPTLTQRDVELVLVAIRSLRHDPLDVSNLSQSSIIVDPHCPRLVTSPQTLACHTDLLD